MNNPEKPIEWSTGNFDFLTTPKLRPRRNDALKIRSFFQELDDIVLNWNRLAAEAYQAPNSRRPYDQMVLTANVNPSKQVVAK
jgi:hypothetical protein